MTYEALVHAERLASAARQDIQVFAMVCKDTGSNAVYLHTANPNGTPYPQDFSHVEWDGPIPWELCDVVDLSTHQVGKAVYGEDTDYVIRKRA